MSKEAGSGKIIHVTTLQDLKEQDLDKRIRGFSSSLIGILEAHALYHTNDATGKRLSTGQAQKAIVDKVRLYFIYTSEHSDD